MKNAKSSELLADHARRKVTLLALTLAFAPMASVYAADWFVTTNGIGNGSSWSSPTNSIQGAINASDAGVTVWVSNGVYEAGGVANYPAGTVLTNRIAIHKAITVRSADNNPTNTVIRGAWDSVATNGPAAVRCVYMADGASLIGFTLTSGATLAINDKDGRGGGVYCDSTSTTISNCVLTGNAAYNYGGGADKGTLFKCTLIGNSSYGYAGGANASILYDSALTSNSVASRGGGSGYGGGAAYSTLYNCTLTGNSSAWGGEGIGGGGSWCWMYNCTLVGNSAPYGGGAYYVGPTYGGLYNCAVVGNEARLVGGGLYSGGGETVYNCTITGNAAPVDGGSGVRDAILWNCISFSNNLGNRGATYYYSTTADPKFVANGIGYGTNHVVGDYRLRDISPVLNAGTNLAYMTNSVDVRSKDLDGRPRIDKVIKQVDMGAYEYEYPLKKGTLIFSR